MIMPFGKYKGQPVENVSPSYLLWVLDNVQDLNPRLQAAIEGALRLSENPATEDIAARVKDQVKSWYRQASLKHHPDHGGSTIAQTVVNDCYQSLNAMVSEIGGGR